MWEQNYKFRFITRPTTDTTWTVYSVVTQNFNLVSKIFKQSSSVCHLKTTWRILEPFESVGLCSLYWIINCTECITFNCAEVNWRVSYNDFKRLTGYHWCKNSDLPEDFLFLLNHTAHSTDHNWQQLSLQSRALS